MQPVTVAIDVSAPREQVFEFLDVLANHEPILDHAFTDWEFSGPRRGVGAKARARANTAGSQDWTEFEVVEVGPDLLVEEGVGNNGKRRTRGTYRLADRGDGSTHVSFELEWLEVAKAERLVPPLTRAFVKRVNAKAMRRLAKRLQGR